MRPASSVTMRQLSPPSACTVSMPGERLELRLPIERLVAELRFDRARAGHRRLERTRRVERDEPPLVDDRDAIAQPVGFVHVVRRHENRELIARA